MNFIIKDFLKIEDLRNKIVSNNLIYIYKFGEKVNFGKITDPLTFLNEIKNIETTLEEAKNQRRIEGNTKHLRKRGAKSETKKVLLLATINIFLNSR